MIQTPGRIINRGNFAILPPKNGARSSKVIAPMAKRTNPMTGDGVLTA